MLVTRKSKRKPSGGLRHSLKRRNKVLTQLANRPALTTLAEEDHRKIVRGKGANKKVKLAAVKFANVVLNKKNFKAEIKTVKANPANREYARRNIITKGALIIVDIKGATKLAKVTSRPGQSGIVNCILVEETQEQKETRERKDSKSKKI
ncbi:MAG: 30S ribosomal protein S8e [Candidatus Diapherotrites archaeon CG08_land_8_20_14_0_20_30_16]|nr:MAG: 30S ribosomal protein S8e [Candidatus Diapherotrites archaeon CG08_land_8_20_14_0_20_30_16]